MRNLLLFLTTSFFYSAACAQAPNPNAIVVGPPIGPVTSNFFAERLDRDFGTISTTSGANPSWGNPDGVIGNAFFYEDWSNGYIQLDNRQIGRDLSLMFNVYKNEIYLKRDSQIIVLDCSVVPVAEFGLNNPAGTKVFRRGFPATGSHTTGTFYEVMAAGKLSLLRLHTKKITESMDQNHMMVKKIADAEFLYAFDSATNTMTEFHRSRNSLIEALPAYAAPIKSILDKTKFRLKDDHEWTLLFNSLNDKP